MNSRYTDVAGTENRKISGSTHFAVLLWTLTSLFALRVLGQAVQHWRPQPYLPPFSAFQGSGLKYPVLLSAQIIILGLMIRASARVGAGTHLAGRRKVRTWGWFGSVYLAGSIVRIVVGLALPDSPPWFRTWIPALFHLVLAGFVLVLALYSRRQLANIERTREAAA